MKTSEVLSRALASLDGGRYWVPGAPVFRPFACAGIAVWNVMGATHEERAAATRALEAAVCSPVVAHVVDLLNGPGLATSIPSWNDAPGRTWGDVEAGFRRAIENARAVESEHAVTAGERALEAVTA